MTVDLASQLLLCRDDENGWLGPIKGLCRECSLVTNQKAFRRLSRRSWEDRAKWGCDKVARARDVQFMDEKTLQRAACPGASASRLRELTLRRLLGVALQNLLDNVTISNMCRHTKCLFYGPDDQWIKDVQSELIRCPQCGQVYRPDTSGKNITPAQQVISMKDPTTGETVCFATKRASANTSSRTWFAEMVSTESENIQPGDDLDTFVRKSVDSLHVFLASVAVRMCFKQLAWNSKIESVLNSATLPGSQWKHLKDHGVHGMKMPLAKATNDVFDNWKMLICLLANLLAAASAITSNL